MMGFDLKSITEGILSGLAKPITDTIQKGIDQKMQATQISADIQNKIIDLFEKSDVMQNEINKIEAQSESKFKSWWRPAVAWICVGGLFWKFIAFPVFLFFNIGTPTIDTAGLMELIMALLGMAGIRSFDKKNGLTK